jgi:hypothetical protein
LKTTLSRLVRVPLREAWKHEAGDFTPWLSEEANLNTLREALGLADLELVATEHWVGEFKLDILCTDGTDQVIIENQLEKTNHSHLGQILTYAAGIDAKKVIWIAEKFRPEHIAALEFLNQHTTLIERLAKQAPQIRPQKPRPQHWLNNSIGRSGFALNPTPAKKATDWAWRCTSAIPRPSGCSKACCRRKTSSSRSWASPWTGRNCRTRIPAGLLSGAPTARSRTRPSGKSSSTVRREADQDERGVPAIDPRSRIADAPESIAPHARWTSASGRTSLKPAPAA